MNFVDFCTSFLKSEMSFRHRSTKVLQEIKKNINCYNVTTDKGNLSVVV